jgi:hypothetical protein
MVDFLFDILFRAVMYVYVHKPNSFVLHRRRGEERREKWWK